MSYGMAQVTEKNIILISLSAVGDGTYATATFQLNKNAAIELCEDLKEAIRKIENAEEK